MASRRGWSEDLGDCGGFLLTNQEVLYTLVREGCSEPADSGTPIDSAVPVDTDDDPETVTPWGSDDRGCQGCSSAGSTGASSLAWLLATLGLVGARRRR